MKYILRFALFITIMAVVVAVPLIVWGKDVSTFIGGLNTSLLALLELFGLILALVFVCFIFFQIIRYYFSPQFVFEGFSNEGDLLANEQKPLQFSKLAWEELADQFHTLLQQWGPYDNSLGSNQGLKVDPDMHRDIFLEKIFTPFNEENFIGAAGTAIVDRVKVAEVKGPENFAVLMSIISFISGIIPPPVTRIVGHLQRQGNPSDRLGITLEFVDDKKPSNLVIHSFWEDESTISISGLSSSGSESLLQQRYRKLLHPTIRWLILECYRRKEEAHISRRNFNFYMRHRKWSETKQAEEAQLFYTLGSLCFASTDEFKAQAKLREFFLQLAINHSLHASKKQPEWYLPYLFRANIHSYEMMLVSQQSPEHRKSLDKALTVYDLALDCKEAKESIENRHRIIVAKALTKLRSGIDKWIDEAYHELEDIKKQQDPANFNPERSDCAIFLYDLASWYALANDMSIPQAKRENFGLEAWRYLAYSLVCSQSKWYQAEADQIFTLLLSVGNLELLKEKLSEKPDLAKETGENFTKEIKKILEETDKRLVQSSS